MQGLNRQTQLNILIGCAHDLLGALHCAMANETNEATVKRAGNATAEKEVREKFAAFARGMNGTYGDYSYMFDKVGDLLEAGGVEALQNCPHDDPLHHHSDGCPSCVNHDRDQECGSTYGKREADGLPPVGIEVHCVKCDTTHRVNIDREKLDIGGLLQTAHDEGNAAAHRFYEHQRIPRKKG